MSFSTTLNEYMEKFGDSPPIFGLPEDVAVKLMKDSIKDGKPAKSNLPEKVLS